MKTYNVKILRAGGADRDAIKFSLEEFSMLLEQSVTNRTATRPIKDGEMAQWRDLKKEITILIVGESSTFFTPAFD